MLLAEHMHNLKIGLKNESGTSSSEDEIKALDSLVPLEATKETLRM